MAGWDAGEVFTSNQQLRVGGGGGDDGFSVSTNTQDGIQLTEVQSKFRQFFREWRENEEFIYRKQLLANYGQDAFYVEVDMADIEKFDADLLEQLRQNPAGVIPVFEEAAKEVVQASTLPRPELATMPNIQIQLKNYQRYTDIRRLEAKDVSKLICVQGIVISAGRTKVKTTNLTIMCRNCHTTRRVHCGSGFNGARLPRTCDYSATHPEVNPKCPLDPFIILPDSSDYVDQQRLKLQEAPETVPTGEMPRHISVSVDRYMAGIVKPGTRVSVIGVYSIFQSKSGAGPQERGGAQAVAIRYPYVRALGITAESEAANLLAGRFTPEEEEELVEMSKTENIYAKIANSIAPAIFGSPDIKKAIACMLFGGSRKHLPDGMRLRGDINVLLLGDPSTAKSQFLKFAIQVAPIGVYTSGKGSSAAGLTASVIRDPASGEFQLEGGALVLADGGLVCIDEFDKMRAQDRVAIHEAMEQQTISIAKAGITTILNSRASVLAAANPVFGRYDDMKTPYENIDFQATILSRFDMIFIVRDIRNDARDQQVAKYVINVHQKGDAASRDNEIKGEFDVDRLKKYIAYARSKCFPRLSAEAAEMLKSHYVEVRAKFKRRKQVSSIPITVRQLEAIVRLSESLAKMELSAVANEEHVREAIRLFTVSTFSSATGNTSGAEALGSELLQRVRKAEDYIRSRVAIGSVASVASLLREKSFPEEAMLRAIDLMSQRGELVYQAMRKTVLRQR